MVWRQMIGLRICLQSPRRNFIFPTCLDDQGSKDDFDHHVVACRINVVQMNTELDWTRDLIWPTDIEVQKSLEEELKVDEVASFRDLVHRNGLKHEVDARLMTYHASKARALRTSLPLVNS